MIEAIKSKITVNCSAHRQPRSGYEDATHCITSTPAQRDILAEFWAAHDSVPLSAIAYAQRRAKIAVKSSQRSRRRGWSSNSI